MSVEARPHIFLKTHAFRQINQKRVETDSRVVFSRVVRVVLEPPDNVVVVSEHFCYSNVMVQVEIFPEFISPRRMQPQKRVSNVHNSRDFWRSQYFLGTFC